MFDAYFSRKKTKCIVYVYLLYLRRRKDGLALNLPLHQARCSSSLVA